MSNPLVYLMYHDKYRDTGDFGGDIQRAMDDVSDLIDETGVTVTKSGKIWADKDPETATYKPEEVIYANQEVNVYPPNVSGNDNPDPIDVKTRSVAIKRIPKQILLPNEEPKSNSIYDRAIVRAKQTIVRPFVDKSEVCPFVGTLAMLWYKIKSEANHRKININQDQVDNTLRLIQKSIPEIKQSNYQLYKYFINRIINSKDLEKTLNSLQQDFVLTAKEMHGLKDFTQEREVQLDDAAYAMGVKSDELISCDLEGNIIGGIGAWHTNQDRWVKDTNDLREGEWYADYHSPYQMNKAFNNKVRKDAFNRIDTGAGKPDYQLIFNPAQLVKKPVNSEFSVDVPSYTLYFWPKGKKPNKDNLVRIETCGWWGDVKRDIISQYPSTQWNYDVNRNGKVPITTFEPVYRRPTWYLRCSNFKCEYRQYYFNDNVSGGGGNDLTELARLTATPNEWAGPDERNMGEYKVEIEELLGISLIDFMNFTASHETCGECGKSLMFVNPQKTMKIDGENVRIPEMTICRDHNWWKKPLVMDNLQTLVRMYGNKKKAAERLNTMATPEGIKHAEQIGDTTYVWDIDWLQHEDQLVVRMRQDVIAKANLTDYVTFTNLRNNLDFYNFNKKQQRFLLNWLYTKRSEQQWEQIEESEFIDVLRSKFTTVTIDTFHDVYASIVKILFDKKYLFKNKELTNTECTYAWALLNGFKYEIQLDAEKKLIKDGSSVYDEWIKNLQKVSFRHLDIINQRANVLETEPEFMFLIREAIKATRKRLATIARTTTWIKEQEKYLNEIKIGNILGEQNRINDIIAASKLANSAAHLAERAKEAVCA